MEGTGTDVGRATAGCCCCGERLVSMKLQLEQMAEALGMGDIQNAAEREEQVTFLS